MAGDKSEDAGSVLKKLGLRPVTKCSLVKFYVPAVGVASYTALGGNVMNPSLFNRIFPETDITNVLLGIAVVGAGAHVYTREHMKAAPTSDKVMYSAAGAFLLSFGSVLFWALLRTIVPPNPTLCTLAGVGTGLTFVKITSSYLDFVDGQVVKK